MSISIGPHNIIGMDARVTTTNFECGVALKKSQHVYDTKCTADFIIRFYAVSTKTLL
jgi:hypothetical protein